MEQSKSSTPQHFTPRRQRCHARYQREIRRYSGYRQKLDGRTHRHQSCLFRLVPQLSLAYDSSAGNGPFGLGWNFSSPAINRKTDKGLPKYEDSHGSGVFILSCAEDLVPVLTRVKGKWQRESRPLHTVEGEMYQIRRYRPCGEGPLPCIVCWDDQQTGEPHWRSISRENIMTLYGKTAKSRIFDPGDSTRVFSWLICQCYDDKGNAIICQFKEENSKAVALSQVHEKNRPAKSQKANRYLKRIKYGNPNLNRDQNWNATDPAQLNDWLFETVFDYGEHDAEDPMPNDAGECLCWHDPESLTDFPGVDNLSEVMAVGLLGSDTACLVWLSPLPGNARRSMQYIDLMGGQKSHLLISTRNDLGAEPRVHEAPSTKLYPDDKASGQPWITKLPFHVHRVRYLEIYNYISRNSFVTRYAYHHGYFDNVERKSRSFGMVEQRDTEKFNALSGDNNALTKNVSATSHLPRVLTRTWFHTDIFLARDCVSNFFAGGADAYDLNEYYRESGLTDTRAKQLPFNNSALPNNLSVEKECKACRALKGSMLRQEGYALADMAKAQDPYTVTEQNLTTRPIRPKAINRHTVFFPQVDVAITYHYERNPAGPRVSHPLTLKVDDFCNVVNSLSMGYGRQQGQSPLLGDDQNKQEQTLITHTVNGVTNPIDDPSAYTDDYRAPLPSETRTSERRGFALALAPNAVRFSFDEFTESNFQHLLALPEIEHEQLIDYTKKQKRPIECVRTFYRKDDLSTQFGKCMLEAMALPGESRKLVFNPGLLNQVNFLGGQKLIPANPADVFEGCGTDCSGYVALDTNSYRWIPGGCVLHSPNAGDTAAQELGYARQQDFLPNRYCEPFHTNPLRAESFVSYDACDPLLNVMLLGTTIGLDPRPFCNRLSNQRH